MRQWARLPHFLLAALVLVANAVAQTEEAASAQPKQAEAKQAETRRQAALGLIEQVLAGVKSLSLPQNRIAIEAEAFPLVWSHSEPQAHGLVNQIVSDFAQAASQREQNKDFSLVQLLSQERQMLVQTIAQLDAQLALQLLNETRPYVHSGTTEEDEAEERQLRLSVAAQEAARNPRHALEMAEKDLQATGDLPGELINLLSQVSARDKQAGLQLFRDIVARVKSRDLTAGMGDFNVAVNLLNVRNNETDGSGADDTLRALADAVASAALSPLFPQNMLGNLDGMQLVFRQLVPAKAQALQQKVQAYERTLSPEQRAWEVFNQAQANGTPEGLLDVAAQAPEGIRTNLYQQIAVRFANDGNYQRATQVAEYVADPSQRDQTLRQALQQAVWGASGRGDFAAARQYAEQITPDEDRATTLAQLAANAANAKQPAVASEMLEEAISLLGNRAQNASEFAAQLQVAQALIQMKSARAVQVLERSASQLEQILDAAVQVDGFLPYQRSFEEGELILSNNFFFNSLIRPYVQVAAQLANSDLPAARTLADRLSLPEARLMAELAVARGALGQPETVGRALGNGGLVIVE